MTMVGNTDRKRSRSLGIPMLLTASLVLAACGGGSGGGNADATESVDLFVSGLSGSGLTLQNNGADDLAVDSNGDASFPTKLAEGESYEVTVLSTPATPQQDCVLKNASGTVDTDTTVEVECGLAYHALTGRWALESEPDTATFGTGLTQSQAAIANAADGTLVFRNDCEHEGRFISRADGGVLGDGSTVEEIAACSDTDRPVPAAFLPDVITLDHPESVDGGVTESAWQIALERVGTATTDGLPDVASGTARIDATDGSVFDSREFVHTIMARKSDNASIDDLVGDWGVVRLEINMGDGPKDILHSSVALPLRITDESGGMFDFSEDFFFTETELIQFATGANTQKEFFTQYKENGKIPMTVDNAQGLITLQGEQSGFMAPDGDFFAWGQSMIRADDPGSEDLLSVHQWLFGVRRDDTPDLDGKTFRIAGPGHFAHSGGFEMVPWIDSASLAFKSGNKVDIVLDTSESSVEFASAGAEITRNNPAASTLSDLDYGVGGTDKPGLIDIDVTAAAGVGDAFLTGFAQLGSRLLVLQYGTATDTGGGDYEGEISILFATCTNCD